MLVLLAALLNAPAFARARPQAAGPELRATEPAPSALLGEPPPEVVLTFDRALVENGTWITVIDDGGTRYDRDDITIAPEDRFTVRVSLEPLPEGRYRVQYNAASLGGSTVTAGGFEFTVDLPDPRLAMRAPLSGAWYESPEVPLEFAVQFFDFDAYDSRIRVYVDGELYDELRGEVGTVEGLAPGVHQIDAVLARFEDEELPGTRHTAYVAIARPPVAPAVVEPPWQGWFAIPETLRVTLTNWRWTVILALALLGLGVLLGATTRRRQPGGGRTPPS